MSWVLERVASGQLSVGDRLPREVDLQEQWGVSRGVVREVMRALEERGVVVIRHGVAGASIAPREAWRVLDRDVARALLDSPDRNRLLEELSECRSLVEPEVARSAAARMTGVDHDELIAALDRIRHVPRKASEDRGIAEITLHRLILRIAGNRPLAATFSPVLDALEHVATSLGRRSTSIEEHAAIVRALAARDPEAAAEAMRLHLEAVAAAWRRRKR